MVEVAGIKIGIFLVNKDLQIYLGVLGSISMHCSAPIMAGNWQEIRLGGGGYSRGCLYVSIHQLAPKKLSLKGGLKVFSTQPASNKS